VNYISSLLESKVRWAGKMETMLYVYVYFISVIIGHISNLIL